MGAPLPQMNPVRCPPGQRGPRGEVLVELKRAQPLTARDLAGKLGISLNAVRHHIKELEAEGLVAYDRRHRGVGAPAFAYHLSPLGEGLFPRRYEATLLQFLDQIVERDGRDAAVRVLEGHFSGLGERLRVETAGLAPARRLEIVAQALADEGYMAEADAHTATIGTLTEHNCAIQAVAERFPELCAAEARFLEDVLGAVVDRRAHILGGCGACEYHVRFDVSARTEEETK
jgi:DeoR family suf operon transcriptional repressor